jgi:hypothetical protein
VERGGLGERGHAELVVEDRDAPPVLPDRVVPASRRRGRAHHRLVGALVARVDIEPAVGGRQRPLAVAGSEVVDDLALEDQCRVTPEALGLDLHPVVETGGVAQREPAQVGRGAIPGGWQEEPFALCVEPACLGIECKDAADDIGHGGLAQGEVTSGDVLAVPDADC